MVAKKPLRSKKKSLHAYSDALKLELKQPPKDSTCASIEPHATSTVEVPSKMSVGKEGEKIKFLRGTKRRRKHFMI